MTSPNPMDMLKQLQESMTATQNELANSSVEATVGGGVVRATVSGKGELLAIKIDPSVVDPDDIETLEDLVVAGVVEAMRQAREMQTKALGTLTGGIDINSVLGGLGGALEP
jgi:DNA-binding YbaB/EbfC family protein